MPGIIDITESGIQVMEKSLKTGISHVETSLKNYYTAVEVNKDHPDPKVPNLIKSITQLLKTSGLGVPLSKESFVKLNRDSRVMLNKHIQGIENLNETLKGITKLADKENKEAIRFKISNEFGEIIKEISENSNIEIISKNKNEDDILILLDELMLDHKEQSNLRRIESLEQKLINNLDENSYSELIKLKSQLNRE